MTDEISQLIKDLEEFKNDMTEEQLVEIKCIATFELQDRDAFKQANELFNLEEPSSCL